MSHFGARRGDGDECLGDMAIVTPTRVPMLGLMRAWHAIFEEPIAQILQSPGAAVQGRWGVHDGVDGRWPGRRA